MHSLKSRLAVRQTSLIQTSIPIRHRAIKPPDFLVVTTMGEIDLLPNTSKPSNEPVSSFSVGDVAPNVFCQQENGSTLPSILARVVNEVSRECIPLAVTTNLQIDEENKCIIFTNYQVVFLNEHSIEDRFLKCVQEA